MQQGALDTAQRSTGALLLACSCPAVTSRLCCMNPFLLACRRRYEPSHSDDEGAAKRTRRASPSR